MAYTPINWQTGDTITAEKMNKMDNGWSVSAGSRTTLCEETVTTAPSEYGNEAELTYTTQITADSIVVTFNNVEYSCPQVIINGVDNGYGGVQSDGAYDFTNYPFAITSIDIPMNIIATETAGTYSVKIETSGEPTVDVSTDFSNAIHACVGISPILCVSGVTNRDDISTSQADGNLLYFWTQNYGCFLITEIGLPCTILPNNENVIASFSRDTGIFTVTES